MTAMRLLCLGVLTSWSAAVAAGEPSVELSKGEDDTVAVTIGGKPFTVFHRGKSLPKPFFSPVRGPDGTVVSRAIVQPGEKGKDHPHHKGIWLAVDQVNGVEFWAEQGRIVNAYVKPVTASGDPAVMQILNHWLDEKGERVVTEDTTVRVFSNRVVEYDTTFSADHGPVRFGDTKEGLFGFRMVDSMREKEGGRVVTSEGAKGTKAAWGQTAKWVDYTGQVEGKTLGVAIFDHPGNFRPSRYHVRDYGLFSVSPFGEKAYAGRDAGEKTLKKGETLRLRYALYVHAGDAKQADVAGAYQTWLAATK